MRYQLEPDKFLQLRFPIISLLFDLWRISAVAQTQPIAIVATEYTYPVHLLIDLPPASETKFVSLGGRKRLLVLGKSPIDHGSEIIE